MTTGNLLCPCEWVAGAAAAAAVAVATTVDAGERHLLVSPSDGVEICIALVSLILWQVSGCIWYSCGGGGGDLIWLAQQH